jgi:hypothetical protein
MSDDNDQFDPQLEALFRREHTHLAAEPFAGATLRMLAAERRRAALRTRLVQAAAVTAVIVLSPLLIGASVWISSRLDELFTSASTWLASPLGLTVGLGLGALAALAAKRARVW